METLLGDEIDIDDIVWYGEVTSVVQMAEECGVAHTAPMAALTEMVAQAQKAGRKVHFLPPYRHETMIRLHDLLGIHPSQQRDAASQELIQAVIQLRLVKSAEEIEELERAAAIGYEMHTTAMRLCRPGVTEAYIGGVLDGIGLGDNSRAALMTRGLVEMTRFGVHFGAQMTTFFGLSGMGDLVCTCTSVHSRNHTAGMMMAEGKTAKEITEGTNMIVEGIRTARLVHDIAVREHIDMPITEEVCHLIDGDHTALEALEALMRRAKKAESETYPM